jgi:hypothetical protein
MPVAEVWHSFEWPRRSLHEPFSEFEHTFTGEMIPILVCRLEIWHGDLPGMPVSDGEPVIQVFIVIDLEPDK